jgi:hypothetical protein
MQTNILLVFVIHLVHRLIISIIIRKIKINTNTRQVMQHRHDQKFKKRKVEIEEKEE